jgi:hypothetical protein
MYFTLTLPMNSPCYQTRYQLGKENYEKNDDNSNPKKATLTGLRFTQ